MMVSTPVKPVPVVDSTTLLDEPEASLDALPIVLRFPEDTPLTDRLLEQISRLNKPLQFERTADGELVIMAASSIDSDAICAELGAQLVNWVRRTGAGGVATGSSGGYIRGDGRTAAPDAAWTSPQRRAALSDEERARAFQPICPDYVIEVRSGSDSIASQQGKMEAWIAGGTELGWLVVPEHETVYVYRRGEPVQMVERPETLSADPVCAGLVMSFEYIWDLESGRGVEQAAE